MTDTDTGWPGPGEPSEEPEDWTRSHSQDPVGADTAQYAAATGNTGCTPHTRLTIHITTPQSGPSEAVRFVIHIQPAVFIALHHQFEMIIYTK